MGPEIAIHGNRSNSHRSRDHVTTESHEAESRCSVYLVHEDDVEVCACEDGDETISEESKSNNGRPDTDAGLLCAVSKRSY